VEIEDANAQRARANFESAGVANLVDSRIGDAAEVLKTIQEPVDFLFLDNNKDGYFACFQAIESRLTNPATIVADNVGRADQMADYLEHVRSHYDSETHWFESRRRPGRRDGMEVSIYRR
jgi:predicted O-methyltransferase YrrM